MKIAIFAPKYSASLAAALKQVSVAELVVCEDSSACTAALRDAEVLFVNGAAYDGAIAEAVRRSSVLRWMQVLSSGTDSLTRHGPLPGNVILTNAASALGPVVAEHAIALTLALLRAIPAMEAAKRERTWSRDRMTGRMSSLDGACVVVVGLGAAGREVVTRAVACGARCVVVRRSAPPHDAVGPDVTFADLDTALPQADVLVMAVPLTPETTAMIDRRRLALLRPHARVVNVARGAVIETAALIDALRTGAIEGAALDVFDDEPLPASSELWDLPNVIVSPHVAGFGSARVAERMTAICVENLRLFETGQLHAG